MLEAIDYPKFTNYLNHLTNWAYEHLGVCKGEKYIDNTIRYMKKKEETIDVKLWAIEEMENDINNLLENQNKLEKENLKLKKQVEALTNLCKNNDLELLVDLTIKNL